MMAARFERDVDSGATGLVGSGPQSMHFGVRLTGPDVPALPHHAAVTHHQAPYSRVRGRGVEPALRELQRASHEGVVGSGEHR